MDLVWLYGWTSFSITAATGHPFPAVDAAAIFALAALLTHLSSGKGRKIVSVLGLQALGFVCAALETLRAVYYASYPLFDKAWLVALYYRSRTPVEWIVLVFVLMWPPVLWAGGVALSRRPRNSFAACTHFDLGLAAFFTLYLMRFALEVKGGMRLHDTVSLNLVFPFFLFGLLAMGVAKNGEGTEKTYVAGYRGVGLVMSASAAALLSVGCLALLSLPWLASAARVGEDVLARGAGPLLPVVERVLRFLFSRGSVRPEPPGPPPPKGTGWQWAVPAAHSWWMDLVEKTLGWTFAVIGGLLLMVLAGLLLFLVARWLLSRTSGSGGERKRRDSLLERAWRALTRWYGRVRCVVRGRDRAAGVYLALCRWGRRSGLPRAASETPTEFGSRLRRHFPRLGASIEVIIGAVNREVYGEVRLSGEQLRPVLSARRALQSPRHWPRRLKHKFSGAGGKAPLPW